MTRYRIVLEYLKTVPPLLTALQAVTALAGMWLFWFVSNTLAARPITQEDGTVVYVLNGHGQWSVWPYNPVDNAGLLMVAEYTLPLLLILLSISLLYGFHLVGRRRARQMRVPVE